MEETNIPDQLTFHEPVPHSQSENRDLLYTVSRIISAVFTPFMVPFVAFVLLFGFTYLRNHLGHDLLFYHSVTHAGHLSVSENQWMGNS